MASSDIMLKEILTDIKNQEIQLPDFQRSWVWDEERIRSLIVSLAHNWPIGAIISLKTGGNFKFGFRPFEGINEEAKQNPDILVLDGQQRLTTILNALFLPNPVDTQTSFKKKVKRFFYFKIEEIAKSSEIDIDWDKVVFFTDERKQKTENIGRDIVLDLSFTKREYKEKCVPANIIFDEVKFSEWRQGYQSYYIESKDINSLNQFSKFEKIRTNIISYRIPVISIEKNTPKEAVCQIFENVNTGGVALDVFELVTAAFSADGYKLRDHWKILKKEFERYPVLEKVTATDFLKTVTLFSQYEAYKENKIFSVQCKRKHILELNLDDYRTNEEKIKNAFIEASAFLYGLCIYNSRNVPYLSQLIPLSALIAVLGDKFKTKLVRDKIEQWYWCGVFGELYGHSTEDRYSRDVIQVLNWIEGNGQIPDTIREAYFLPDHLSDLKTKNSSAYKGIMALLLKESNIKDFISGQGMRDAKFWDDNVDIHHIFPRAYCEKKEINPKKIDSIVNKTMLSSKSNRIISGAAPSKYLEKLVNGNYIEYSDLQEILEAHGINPEYIYLNDFDKFFNYRSEFLINLIKKAMKK
ncbi:MAG: DUF262 domain-containing protein [Alphaproteobacteria bacterium]|nr:DUF262 domain-containing protein [Alphaproteobacteria bacterium]